MRAALALLQLSIALSGAIFAIPRPAGPYGVNFAVRGLTDTSRLDPFAPKPENRSVAISVFYPVAPADQCSWKLVPAYPKRSAALLDAETAFAGVPNGSLEKVRLQVCLPKSSSSQKPRGGGLDKLPVVLFSGGLETGRLWYSALAQSVASFGFVVVAVDHPYDADFVEFPDGRLILGINSTWDDAQLLQDVEVRAADVSFVLNQLSTPAVLDGLSGSYCQTGLMTNRAGIFGHSLGGATAAMAELLDSRFVGGVNLDGALYGPVINKGLKNPFMLFGHKDNSTPPTWAQIWPHLNWKLDIELLNSTHVTFTDIPLLADLIFGIPPPPAVQGVVGKIPGERARDVITAYVVAFMKETLECEPQALLQRPSAEYPEVEFEAAPPPA